MTRSAVVPLIALATLVAGASYRQASAPVPVPNVQFVFTSDAHYGLARTAFRGEAMVDAHIVNAALVARINELPGVVFPHDGGVGESSAIGPIDFVAEGGDITNREEVTDLGTIPSASVSWRQFQHDYIDGVSVTSHAGYRAPVYAVPGNHDVSNAVGFYRPMAPLIDKRAMVEIYNRTMAPGTPETVGTYDYWKDPVMFSRDVGGVHFVFVEVWLDSRAREWMARDLERVPGATPVVVFTHDQPDVEAKHFRNPVGAHDINARDRFENLLADQFADGTTIETPSVIEQAALEQFLVGHPNVVAYFHGNSNWNQFYDWTGPAKRLTLHTFRVDSPIKGKFSSDDETKLSFHVATIDPTSHTMTVRECLWNADPGHPSAAMRWGSSSTVSVRPR